MMRSFFVVALVYAGALFAKCGEVPYPSNTGYVTPSPIVDSPEVWSFVTEPNLHPLKIVVNKNEPGCAPGHIFIAPYGFSEDAMYGQPGSLIMDSEGNPIWFRALASPNLMNTDFRVQTYKGKNVLTFWQGTLATPPAYTNVPGGSSEPGSCYYILNDRYKVIKTVSAKRGFTSDIHEFLITPKNTALLLSTQVVPMDLTPYGGPANGYVQDFAIQEIDLETNELLFFWDALEHISLFDSYESASSGSVWDAYHCNSIGLTESEDDIILSSRSMWTIYKINKPTGNIIWRLGGKQSDFTIASGAEFSWQHDARFLPNNVISMFDDNSDGSTTIPPSHGLMLKLDFGTMTANLYRSYYHDPNISVASQGNTQSLPNGNKFVGWGQSQYFSEFRGAGNTEGDPSVNFLYDAAIPSTDYTYRAYKHCWKGRPCNRPKVVVDEGTLYVSWNGTTETKTWKVYAGTSRNKLSCIACKEKTGFETAIEVSQYPYYLVKAIDSKGKVLCVSKIFHVLF